MQNTATLLIKQKIVDLIANKAKNRSNEVIGKQLGSICSRRTNFEKIDQFNTFFKRRNRTLHSQSRKDLLYTTEIV